MRWLMVLAVLCGCPDPTMNADGGLRTVLIQPMTMGLTNTRPEPQPQRRYETYWWTADGGKEEPITETIDRFKRFEVPDGPALFEFYPRTFVYSSASKLTPCDLQLISGYSTGDAGVELNFALTQPAVAGDSLDVASSLNPWHGGPLVEPTPGRDVVSQRVEWRGHPILAGTTLVGHRTTAAPIAGLERTTMIGMLDAGLIDQYADHSAALNGVFAPVAPGPELPLEWDSNSLSTPADVRGVSLSAIRNGLPLATVATTNATPNAPVPLAMPALTPDTVSVFAKLDFALAGGSAWRTIAMWRGPWSPVMSAPVRPPTDVLIAEDGSRVSWTPPAAAPALYMVTLWQRGESESRALIFTDETSVPIPASLLGQKMFAQVTSLSGTGLSASGCAYFEHLDRWALFPAVSPLWAR